jgi:hypothetical protein
VPDRYDDENREPKHSFPHNTRAEMSSAKAQMTYTTAVAMQVPAKPRPSISRFMLGSLPQGYHI